MTVSTGVLTVAAADTFLESFAALPDAARRMRPEEIVLVARSQGLAALYVSALREAGIEVSPITRDSAPGSGVRVSTMHRVKGLEFRSVFIVACSANCLPPAAFRRG